MNRQEQIAQATQNDTIASMIGRHAPSFELVFENEQDGQVVRFACDEDGIPLQPAKDFTSAVDNFRFIGMATRRPFGF